MRKRINALGMPCPVSASRFTGARASPANNMSAADCVALTAASLLSVRAIKAAHVGIKPGTAFASASADVGAGLSVICIHSAAHAHSAA